MLGIICRSLFFSTFLLSRHLDKGSSLSHRSINTVPKLFWLTFVQTLILPFYFWCWSEVSILLCSICNSVSKSPEDSRLSEHHPSFLEVVGDFTDTSFRVHFHSFNDLSVINYCCFLSRSGRCWLLVVSKPFVFAITLIDFLFSLSIQIACFSLKVSSLIFILVCVCHHRM